MLNLPTEIDARHHAKLVAAYLDTMIRSNTVDVIQCVQLAQVYSSLIVNRFFDNQIIQSQMLSKKNDEHVKEMQKDL